MHNKNWWPLPANIILCKSTGIDRLLCTAADTREPKNSNVQYNKSIVAKELHYETVLEI